MTMFNVNATRAPRWSLLLASFVFSHAMGATTYSIDTQSNVATRAPISNGANAVAGSPDVLFGNSFELGLGINLIADRAVFLGESVAVQAVAVPFLMPSVLVYSLPRAPSGASINAQTGVIAWTPTASQTGTASFIVRVTDQSNARADASFNVGVLSTNRRPRLNAVADQRMRIGASVSVVLSAIDPDAGDTLSFAKLAGPATLAVTAAGALSWTPTVADLGQVLVRVGVVDSAGESDVTQFFITVERANQAPVLAALPSRVATVGRLLAFTVVATDPDAGDTLTYALSLAPAGATIGSANGAMQYTPVAPQLGRQRIRVDVVDTLGDSASGEFDVDVIAATAPIAVDDEYAVTVGETLSIAAPGVLGNDSDANQDSLTAALVTGTSGGTLNLQPSGAFTYTPAPEAPGSARQAQGTTVLSIDFENGIPSVVAPGQSTLTGVQGYAGLGAPGNQFGGSFLRGGANVPVTVTLVNLPPHSALDLGVLLGIIDSWDGSGNFPAGDNFEVTLDGNVVFFESFANALASQTQTYVPPPGVQLARRVELGFGGGGFFSDSAYDLGADPVLQGIPHTASTATITFKSVAIDQGINDESWAIDNLRIALATPSDQFSIDSFTYTANDDVSTSPPANVRITVRPEVFPPRVVSQPPLNAASGVPYRYDVLALSSEPGDVLSFAFDQAPAGATISSAGVIAWTPTAAQIGTNRFNVRVTDPRAASGSQVFVVSVTEAVATPNVIGQTQAAASSTLSAANLAVGELTPVPSASVPIGAVVAQSPAAGTPLPRAARIALDISTGPAPRPVPDVVGRTRAAGEGLLADAGFALGAVAFATDALLPPGTILLQAPPAATYVSPGSAVNLTIVSGPPLRFALPRSLLDAGESMTLSAQAIDANGTPSQPQPSIAFSVSAEPGLSSGAAATVSGNTLNTASTTRGRYRVRATRSDTSAVAEALLTVTAPRPATPQFAAHERFRALIAALPERYRQLQIAALANNTVALAALRADFGVLANALRADLALLRLAPITAPESGFFPGLAVMTAAGFPETAADRMWLGTITATNAQIGAASIALAALNVNSGDADLAPLRALDEQLRLRSVRLDTLTPTPHSAVSSNGQTAALLASRLPRLVLAELDSFVRMLEPAPPAPGRQVQFAGALAGAALASGLRNHVVDKIYGDAIDHVVNSGIVLAFAGLLRQFIGPTEGMDVLTGASLAIHLFTLPGSSLDGTFNPIAEMNEVLMIGPDAVQAIRDLLGTLNLEGTGSARELMEKFQAVADAGNGVVAAYEEANSMPDRASIGCLLTDADCVSLSWDAGFASVNEGGNLRLPGPVLILVRDLADSRVHFTVAGFLGQPDPDED